MKIRIVTGIAALAVISACGTSTTLSAKTSPQNTVRTIDLAAATELKVGDDLPVIATLPTNRGKREVYFDGFADDNTLFGKMGLPEPVHDTIPGAVESRTYPFLYDLNTEKFTVLDESSRSEVPYVADIATTADTVVWTEGHGVSTETGDFEIRSFDRRTGSVTKLGRSTDTSGQVAYNRDLVVHDGTAYFSTHAFNRKKGKRPAIHSVPVDGSRALKMLVPDAEGIKLDGQSLTFEKEGSQQAIDLTTGAVTPVPANRFADDPGFCGAGTTTTTEYWCIGVPVVIEDDDPLFADPVLTFKEPSGRTTTIATSTGGDDENYPTPSRLQEYGDWIGFTVSGGDWPAPQFLIDLDNRTARIMPQDIMLDETSPAHTLALVYKVTSTGGTPVRVVKLPKA